MYDDVLFPVSFYFLDDDELAAHGRAVAEAFDARVHVLTMVLEDESRSEREDHEEAFEAFIAELEDAAGEVTAEFRDGPVAYEDVGEAILDELDGHDLLVMGHTRVREEGTPTATTAERVINGADVPTLVVPLKTPRFRGLS